LKPPSTGVTVLSGFSPLLLQSLTLPIPTAAPSRGILILMFPKRIFREIPAFRVKTAQFGEKNHHSRAKIPLMRHLLPNEQFPHDFLRRRPSAAIFLVKLQTPVILRS